jgi:hypothetical protein
MLKQYLRQVMLGGFGGVGLLEWVMLPNYKEALRYRGSIRPSTAAG